MAVENRYRNLEFNKDVKAEINTTPEAETPTYADMTKCFKSINQAINENVFSATYLADDGFGSSFVTGAAPTISLSGDYYKGDPCCEYLNKIQYEVGEKRITDVKLTRGGKLITGSVTLTSVAIAMGEATGANAVSITMSFNGKPVMTDVPVDTPTVDTPTE